MNEEEGKKFLEKADIINRKLLRTLVDNVGDDVMSINLMVYSMAKTAADVLLALEEDYEQVNVEKDFIKTVKKLKKIMKEKKNARRNWDVWEDDIEDEDFDSHEYIPEDENLAN